MDSCLVIQHYWSTLCTASRPHTPPQDKREAPSCKCPPTLTISNMFPGHSNSVVALQLEWYLACSRCLINNYMLIRRDSVNRNNLRGHMCKTSTTAYTFINHLYSVCFQKRKHVIRCFIQLTEGRRSKMMQLGDIKEIYSVKTQHRYLEGS